jgi:hypothetical protein
MDALKDETILFTNAEGMTSKGDINLLKSLIYAEPVSAQPLDFCDLVGYTDHPTWANGPNKLYSACPQVFIGVGTTNPAFPLDVNGSAKVSSHLWANGSLSVGADVNPFSKLNVVNTNRPAAIQISTVGNPKPYQRLMFFEYDNPDTKILEVQNPTSGYTAFSLKANGEMDIHNGTAPIFHLGTNGMLSLSNGLQKTFVVEASGITRARKVIVDTQTWADYVFDENYSLMPLSEVESFLKANKHLPAIPSEKAMKDEGIDLAEMNVKMMEKIEELTLYLIQQNKELEQVKAELETLKQQKL